MNANLHATSIDYYATSIDTHIPAEDFSVVEIGEMMVLFNEDSEMEQTINRDIERVGYGEGSTGGVVGAKKTRKLIYKTVESRRRLTRPDAFCSRTPYLYLANFLRTVARYGQMWDLVQNARPTRGYGSDGSGSLIIKCVRY